MPSGTGEETVLDASMHFTGKGDVLPLMAVGEKNCQWNHKGWPIILAIWGTQAGEFQIRDLIGLHGKTLSRKEVGDKRPGMWLRRVLT